MRPSIRLAAPLGLMLLALAGFAAAITRPAGAASPSNSSSTQEIAQPANAYEAAETFLRHLRKGDFAKAYAMTAPELQSIVTADDFRKQVQLFQQVGIKTVRWHDLKVNMKLIDFQPGKGLRWNVTTNQFQGQLGTVRNGDLGLTFNWINEDGTWRMLVFRWDQAAKTSQAN